MSHMVAYELHKLCGNRTMGLPGDTGLYTYMPCSIGNYGITWDTILSVILTYALYCGTSKFIISRINS